LAAEASIEAAEASIEAAEGSIEAEAASMAVEAVSVEVAEVAEAAGAVNRIMTWPVGFTPIGHVFSLFFISCKYARTR
jgi:hypothetical protein